MGLTLDLLAHRERGHEQEAIIESDSLETTSVHVDGIPREIFCMETANRNWELARWPRKKRGAEMYSASSEVSSVAAVRLPSAVVANSWPSLDCKGVASQGIAS